MPLDMSLTAGTRVSYRVMPVADLGRSYRLWRAIRGILAEEPEFIAVAAADTAQTLDTLRAIQTLWDIPVFAAVRADAAPTEVAPLREAGIHSVHEPPEELAPALADLYISLKATGRL